MAAKQTPAVAAVSGPDLERFLVDLNLGHWRIAGLDETVVARHRPALETLAAHIGRAHREGELAKVQS